MNRPSQLSSFAVVLAAHGSSHDGRINRPLFRLAEHIAASGNFGKVTPAFLDGQPRVDSVLDEIQQESVVVIPVMTSCGYYTEVVFPKRLASANNQVLFAPPIGQHPLLAELVADDIRVSLAEAAPRQSLAIIVVGHGTRRNKKSCLTTVRLVQGLRKQLPNHRVRFAFLDQRPYLEHVVATTPDEKVVVVPFLMGLGPHATCDIPKAFGGGNLTEPILQNQSGFPFHWLANVGGETRQIVLGRPVGTYPAWSEICTALATASIYKELAA